MSALPKFKKTKVSKPPLPPMTRVLRDRGASKKPTESTFLLSEFQTNVASTAGNQRGHLGGPRVDMFSLLARTRSLDREIEGDREESERPDEIDDWNNGGEFNVSDGLNKAMAQYQSLPRQSLKAKANPVDKHPREPTGTLPVVLMKKQRTNTVVQAVTATKSMLELRVAAGKGRDPAEGPGILKKAPSKGQATCAKPGAYTQVERVIQ